MAMSFLPSQLERLRREAKKLGRELSIPHSEALDRIAVKNGFTNWSLLSKHSSGPLSPGTQASGALARPTDAVRYYLHGDVLESDPTQCYCARCDLFAPLAHLVPKSAHADGRDGERFLSNLANWQRWAVPDRGRLFRPDGAPNILEAAARASRAAREAARSPFHRWLEAQRNRKGHIGDLAGDVLSDEGFPVAASTRREVENYLRSYGAHVIQAVRAAWREFEGALPRKRTLAQALAEELGILVEEADELTGAEPMELTGNSGDGAYGWEFDFSLHASPALAAKLTEMRGSLKLTVGPSFYEGLRSDDFPN